MMQCKVIMERHQLQFEEAMNEALKLIPHYSEIKYSISPDQNQSRGVVYTALIIYESTK